MDDTTQAAHVAVRDAVLRLSPAERVREMLALSERMRELSLQRLRVKYPTRTTLELVELLLGETLVPDADRATIRSRAAGETTSLPHHRRE